MFKTKVEKDRYDYVAVMASRNGFQWMSITLDNEDQLRQIYAAIGQHLGNSDPLDTLEDAVERKANREYVMVSRVTARFALHLMQDDEIEWYEDFEENGEKPYPYSWEKAELTQALNGETT